MDVKMKEEVDDEDYRPEEDPQDDEDEDELLLVVAPIEPTLSSIQKQRVDESFERIFGYKWGTEFQLPVQMSARERQFERVLGARIAAAVMRTGPAGRKRQLKAFKKPSHIYKPIVAATVTKPSSKAAPRRSASAKGMDSVLEGLQTKKVSTVAKTHEDWDQFKDQTGLGEKLEAQTESNAAYLKRQDFLSRVDERRFDLERQERERSQLKRK